MADDTGTSRRLRTMAFKFVFAASLVAVAFAATYASSEAAFSDYDLRNVVALGATVNVAALLVALFALRRKDVANAALSLIVLAGIGTAYIAHTDLWLAGNRAVLVALCAMSLAGLFVAFRVIDESRGWVAAALPAAALLGLSMVAGGHPADRSPVPGDLSNIRQVSFQRTPNLYFVSFDGIIPRSLLRKYLGVETTGFNDLLDGEMRRFPNLFIDAVRTTNSLNTLLALEVEVYTSQRRMLKKRGRDPNPFLFAGQNPSALLELLRRNGYETTTIYLDSYLGRRKGPFVDHYVRFIEKGVCEKLDSSVRNIAFWGYCHWFDPGHLPWGLIVDRIEKVPPGGRPQFVMAYLGWPKHVHKAFRYDDAGQVEWYRKRYTRRIEEAAGYLERIVRHLEENDPGAILLVFGDHGLFLSQGMEFEEDPAFVVQDNYGVLGGVWPRDACAVWLDEAAAKGWMTVLDAVHAILRCLSGGEGALVAPRQGRSPQYGPVPGGLDFADFLYE